jgi:hypothetical protein
MSDNEYRKAINQIEEKTGKMQLVYSIEQQLARKNRERKEIDRLTALYLAEGREIKTIPKGFRADPPKCPKGRDGI